MTNPDNLFRFQAKIIKEIAQRESCIFAGRAANYVLREAGMEDVISIFVYADMKKKIERIMDLEKTDAETAERHVREKDRDRAEFYRYYTGLDWLDMQNYDLCIDSSDISYPQIAKIIKDYMHTRGYDI